MLKRILFTLMTIMVLYSLALVGYRVYEPTTIDDGPITATYISLDLETLPEYTLSSGTSSIHYYFFYATDQNDSIYVENTLLSSVASTMNNNALQLIEYVDMTSIDEDTRYSLLRSQWDINNYPALLACHNADNEIIIDNTLEWTTESPLSAEDILDWFILNGLYTSN